MSITEPTVVPCSHCGGTGSITLPPEIATVEAYYFGCHSESGHYWWYPDRIGARQGRFGRIQDTVGPKIHPRIDSGFCPKSDIQGNGMLTEIEGWTILSFWDNSVDKRKNSSSSFVARGSYDFDAMRAIAEAQFPRVWKRYAFPIVLAP